MEIITTASTFVGILLLTAVSALVVWCVFDVLRDEYEAWQARRQALIETELDAKSGELRQTILSLADELASDRDEASKALTRATFLATGRTDRPRS